MESERGYLILGHCLANVFFTLEQEKVCIFKKKSDNEARYCGVWACSEMLKSPLPMPPTARPALLLSFTESPGPDSPSPSQTLTLLLLFSLFPKFQPQLLRKVSHV